MIIFKEIETNRIIEFLNNEQVGSTFLNTEKYSNITDTQEGQYYLLQKAKDNKLAQLEAFILVKKTEKYTSHLAPEIIDGSRIGAEVKFYWHVDSIPNSNLTPESVLNKCTMDYVSCMNLAKKTGTDYASEKTIYDNCIKQKIVPYSTTIVKKDAEGKDKEQAGVVNIFPVAFSIADHIQNREINNNKLLKIKEIEINACKSVEEVEAIKFE
jgi:hypothetical protein